MHMQGCLGYISCGSLLKHMRLHPLPTRAWGWNASLPMQAFGLGVNSERQRLFEHPWQRCVHALAPVVHIGTVSYSSNAATRETV